MAVLHGPRRILGTKSSPSYHEVFLLKHLLRTFYDDRMSCPSGGYSPSGEKPTSVYEDWVQHRLVKRVVFDPISIEELQMVHDPQYVLDVFSGEVSNGHGNTDAAVAESTRWTVGSMVAAAEDALESGMACSPSSGFHHAGFASNHGFCTFNGLMVAANRLLQRVEINNIGILDCDWHAGDGTDDIIREMGLQDSILHFSSGAQRLANSRRYFVWLDDVIKVMREARVDIVLYQAGADAHRDDPLGGVLDDAELSERDRVVFDQFLTQRVPIVWNLAGGYQRDAEGSISPVLDIHRTTALHALAVLQEQQAIRRASPQSFFQDDDSTHPLEQVNLKSIQKGKDFFKSRKLSLSRFGLEKTYDHHLEGSPESISHCIMVDFERRKKQSACKGTGFTFIRPGVFPLPRYCFKATLESPYPTSSGAPDDFSRLQICWFGDVLGQSIDEMVFLALGKVDWNATATNYDRYYV
ncbi:MAG TPA: hypothetical protein DEF45_01405 [Rhodopirellula sp.]|nr:hypothetical protein [Rhodopirellula sp.]